MNYNIEDLNPDFRKLTDLLFLSDRMDLDLSNYKNLLKSNQNHYNYFWRVFYNSSKVFWNSDFWNNRLSFLFSLDLKNLKKDISYNFRNKLLNEIKFNKKINIKTNTRLIQFVEFCNIKKKNNLSLYSTKQFLVKNCLYLKRENIFDFIINFVPSVFSSFDEFLEELLKLDYKSYYNLNVVLYLYKKSKSFNTNIFVSMFKSLISKKQSVRNRRDIIYKLLENNEILCIIKDNMNDDLKLKLKKLIDNSSFQEFNYNHLKNIKILISLNKEFADIVIYKYIDTIYARHIFNRKSNSDKLIALINLIPEASAKKVLSYIASKNKMNDIKYVVQKYPKLSSLLAFI